MSGYLLDTNILSEVMKPKPDVGVVKFLDGLEEAYISVLTIHELYFGIELLKDTVRKQSLTLAVEELTATFKDHILPVNQPESRVAADMRATSQKGGRQLHVIDSLIAATAFTNGLTVLTRNEKDFLDLHVPISNPWLNK